MSPYEDVMNRDSPDGRRIERNSASIRFPLQGEAVALAELLLQIGGSSLMGVARREIATSAIWNAT